MGQNSESQSLHPRSELSLQIANQDGEAVAVLLLLVVLEFPVAEGLLNSMPEGAKRAALLLYLRRRELPRQIDSVEVIVIKEPLHGVDELGPRLWRLCLRDTKRHPSC